MYNRDAIDVSDYLDNLEEFLTERFGDEACSDFFLSEHPAGGVTANLLIGTNFQTDEVKQINVILVSKDDIEKDDCSNEDPFDAARGVLG